MPSLAYWRPCRTRRFREAAAAAWADDGSPPLGAEAEWAALAALQGRVDAALGAGGLAFRPGLVALGPGGPAAARRVAEVMRHEAAAGLKVLCFTAKPGGRWPTHASCAELASRRAHMVRELLAQAGCTCTIIPVGNGYADERGARCELVVCSVREAGRAVADLAPSALPADGRLRVEFAPPGGGAEAGAAVAVEFRRAPLGLVFSRAMPSAITEVEPGGHAAELGLQVGWTFTAIAGHDLADSDFPTLLRLLEDGVARLPWA